MREIIFRGKRIDNGEWVEGYFAIICEKTVIIEKESEKYYSIDDEKNSRGNRIIEIDPETICQFTGLCDKNGNKIWENDIIKYHFGEIYAPIKYGCYQNCFDSQKAEHIGFYVDWSDDKCLRKDLGYWIDMVDAIPAGNIFDNPELLQVDGEINKKRFFRNHV